MKYLQNIMREISILKDTYYVEKKDGKEDEMRKEANKLIKNCYFYSYTFFESDKKNMLEVREFEIIKL